MQDYKKIKKIEETPLYWVGYKVYSVQFSIIKIVAGGMQDQEDIDLLIFLNSK